MSIATIPRFPENLRRFFMVATGCLVASGCTMINDNSLTGQTVSESGRTPLLFAIASEELTSADAVGTIFFSVRGYEGGSPTQWRTTIDGTTWLRAVRTDPSHSIDITRHYPWREDYLFEVPANTHLIHMIDGLRGSCDEHCSLDIYYTDQIITNMTSTELMWMSAPERWQRAEFEYRFDDRIAASSIESYDEESGMAVVNIGMITLDPSGGQLQVSMQPHSLRVYDSLHGLRQNLDGSEPEFGDFWSDAGTRE